VIFVLVAACGGGGASAPTVTVTAPEGFGELVPGKTVAVGWTATGDFAPIDTTVALALRGGTATHTIVDHGVGGDGTTALTDSGFTWAGLDRGSQPVPLGYYDLTIDLGDGPIDAGDAHVIVVQGVAFTDTAAVTVSQAAPGTIDFETSTSSTIDVKMFAGTYPIADTSVPSELHPIARTVTWNGTDTGGAAIPPGTYALGGTVTDAAAGVTYSITGGTAIVR
jgi:hypothetical protein